MNLLTLPEVSLMLRVSKTTLKRWEKKGLIRSVRINERGDRRYFDEEIMKFIEERG
jgi:DNA-binding transcriptional MerR regulator